jgi:hypothetical protein
MPGLSFERYLVERRWFLHDLPHSAFSAWIEKKHHLTETNADQMVQRHGPHAKLHIDQQNPFLTACRKRRFAFPGYPNPWPFRFMRAR